MTQIHYPQKPPVEPPKPEHLTKDRDLPGLWMTHDPAIYHDPVSHNYYIYSTGAICKRSKDLLHWESLGKVVSDPPEESVNWTKSHDIWAPDIVKVGAEYRLYCSNSSWGVRQSCIFLAVSDTPEGPFIPRGCVLKTSDALPVNAIDANIIEDADSGKQYLLYGSFWGGCHILLLDKATGLAAEDGIGTCVARRPSWTDCSIEGPYMIYHPETKYYYLFVSYGSLKSDYNIRIGRSRNITGPFYDFHGRDMTDINDEDCSVGLMISCGYRWLDGTPYMAPGHNSVLQDDDGRMFLVSHIREMNFKSEPEPSTMQIRQLYLTPDEWLIAAAQPYAGETLQTLSESDIIGSYERIALTPSIPQGIMCAHPMRLMENGRMECCSIVGTWKMVSEHTLTIQYGTITETVIASPAWDKELERPTLMLSGLSNKGVCTWYKKRPS
ncbi:MAG: arabinan endo-1,5-alpha-L-arabinosidase [Bacillus sp. (in: Bacteria)]|nr:arabinan endo-1,5-alpha-L-arabinosidase [Bacillus sp. (in: firmicutes)]MCM1426824.1 arabinan endo-1,5-alpha-L-arabinosidase [Eubacterium sp.]